MEFKPVPVPPSDAYKMVPLQNHFPEYQKGLDTNDWTDYLAKYPEGNPDDFQVNFNNTVISQGNRRSADALSHAQYQASYYNQNRGSAGAWGPIPVPPPLPEQRFFYTAASITDLTGPLNVKPWTPEDFFGA